jgi:hypothetical protein
MSRVVDRCFVCIDKIFAKYYGFAEENLDFIINYDIKYRMGGEWEKRNGKHGEWWNIKIVWFILQEKEGK